LFDSIAIHYPSNSDRLNALVDPILTAGHSPLDHAEITLQTQPAIAVISPTA